MNEKDVKAEIKRLKTKIKGDMYEDMETLQQIYELKLILNPEIENKPELDDDECLSCGAQIKTNGEETKKKTNYKKEV